MNIQTFFLHFVSQHIDKIGLYQVVLYNVQDINCFSNTLILFA